MSGLGQGKARADGEELEGGDEEEEEGELPEWVEEVVGGLVALAGSAEQSESLTALGLEGSQAYALRFPRQVGLALLRVERTLARNRARAQPPPSTTSSSNMQAEAEDTRAAAPSAVMDSPPAAEEVIVVAPQPSLAAAVEQQQEAAVSDR